VGCDLHTCPSGQRRGDRRQEHLGSQDRADARALFVDATERAAREHRSAPAPHEARRDSVEARDEGCSESPKVLQPRSERFSSPCRDAGPTAAVERCPRKVLERDRSTPYEVAPGQAIAIKRDSPRASVESTVGLRPMSRDVSDRGSCNSSADPARLIDCRRFPERLFIFSASLSSRLAGPALAISVPHELKSCS